MGVDLENKKGGATHKSIILNQLYVIYRNRMFMPKKSENLISWKFK